MTEQNEGQAGDKPSELTVVYDPKDQRVGLKFNSQEFRHWDFVIGILEMAKHHAEDKKREALIALMQQQEALAQQQARVERAMNADGGLRKLIQA